MNIRRILVIDDNPAIFEDFKKVLCPQTEPSPDLVNLGNFILGEKPYTPIASTYALTYADQGQEGLRQVQKALTKNIPFDLAFVDMKMPNGWNGLQTIQAIWKVQPSLQVILCTAYSDFSWKQIRTELSDSDRFFILKKPFDNIEVQQLTEALINRQDAELQLIRNQEILQAAQTAALVGYFTQDLQTQTTTRSKVLEKIFGIPPEFKESLNGLIELIDMPYRKTLEEAINRANKNGERFELSVQITRWSDQTQRRLLISGSWDAGTNLMPIRFILTAQDITHLQRMEERLNLLEAGISQIDDPIIITDSGRGSPLGPKIVFVNNAFTQKTGYSELEVLNKNPRFLQGKNTSNKEIQRIRQAILSNQAIRCELINYDKGGNEFLVDLSLTPIQDPDGRISHWIGIIRDPSPESVLNAIELVNQGATWLNQKATEQIISCLSASNPHDHVALAQKKIASLSPKELEIIRSFLEAPEQSRKNMADRLFISEHTLRNHLASIYEKLGIHSRLELHLFCQQFIA